MTEIDEQLNVLSTQFYNIYDLPNTFWGQLTYSGNEWASITFPATHKVFGDTLFSIKDYWLSEVDDDFNLLGIDFSKRFEKVGLDGAIYDSGTELPGVYYYQTSAISDEHIFVFGGLRDEGGQNSFPVGRFDRNGNLTGLFTYDPPLGSTAQFYATGQLHQGRLFATYQSESTNLPGCPSESVDIDIRDADSFEAIQQFKLPDCGLGLGLKRPFLFLEDGSFYYLAAGEWAQAETRVYLYKYSSSYELEWQQSYELPSHLPKAIHRTDGDGILIACIDRSSGSTFQLYKLNADGGIITGATLALPPEPPRVFPNPFQNELNLTVANKAVQARIYAMDGKSYGEFLCRNGQLQLGHLPAGPYALQLFDLESGAHLGRLHPTRFSHSLKAYPSDLLASKAFSSGPFPDFGQLRIKLGVHHVYVVTAWISP